MALIASSFTMEIILLIIGLYLFDGGIIRKFSAIGLFVIDLNLTISTQTYVSDLTSTPSNVSLFFTPAIQNAWALMLVLLTLTTMAWTFISIGRIIVWWNGLNQSERASIAKWTFIIEELV